MAELDNFLQPYYIKDPKNNEEVTALNIWDSLLIRTLMIMNYRERENITE